MVAVAIRHLTRRFGNFVALDGIDLRIERGELFFLLGPSGCGKTTLLRHIAGFFIPDEGEILFDDQNVTRLPPHRRHAAMMFQSYALWPHMSVAENVAFGLEERKTRRAEIKQRVAAALESVRMGGYGDRRINQLSGGQQQRVALARALVVRPRCLLLDEPLSNLDAKLRLEMRQEIRRVCKESGLTAIYVTHDQKEALSIADRLAVLNAGKIAQVGTPRDVYRRPASRYVADFIGEANFLDGTIGKRKLDGAPSDRTRVETAFGECLATISDPAWIPSPGEQVNLCIRPESWRLGQAPGEAAAGLLSIRGVIGRSVYLGEVAEYTFQPALPGSAPLKILELNPRFVEAAADGAEIVAQVTPEDVIILRRQ